MNLGPAVFLATIAATSTLFAQPQFFPNSQKYADSGIPSAKGRSGSASVEVRALLNSNDTTDVEVTAAAPGSIAKVQIDLPAGGTQNFNDLDAGGAFAANVRGLPARSKAGVQVSVRDVDGARTDVVSVEETVKRRPDLLVTGIASPPHAYAGLTTTLRATIRELNGDVGARANCRLLVNGVAVDRAEGIWVDAGDSVDCSFAHVFTTLGAATIEVVADGVDPGDWDGANNSTWRHIEVRPPPQDFYSWTASASEDESDHYRYEQYSWGEFYTDNVGINQGFQFTGVIRDDFGHWGMKLRAAATTDGLPLYSGQASDFWGPFTRHDGRCSFSESRQPEVYVCWDNDMQYTTVEVTFGASDVVYRSWGWATQRHPWAPTEPRFEWNQTYVSDNVENRFGSTVGMDVTFEAAGSTWAAQPSIPIDREWRFDWVQPFQCYYEEFFGFTICSEVDSHTVRRWGSSSGF